MEAGLHSDLTEQKFVSGFCQNEADGSLAYIGKSILSEKPYIAKATRALVYNFSVIKNYPHITFILYSYVIAILLFLLLGHQFFHQLVTPFGIGGIFIAGMMYSYSFTIGLGALLLPAFLEHFSPGVIAVIGGLGGTFADATLFKLFKGNLKKEMKRFGATKFMKLVSALPLMNHRWFRDVLGFLTIISPLPDEIGIAIMASAHLSENMFRLLSLIANIVGIYLLVSVASVIY
jgi:hypothetical protein